MRRFLVTGLMLACAATVSAQVILDEPFDYASNDALNAAWSASGSSNPDYALDLSFGNPEPSYGLAAPGANYQGRLARNLGGDFDGTDAEPLVLSYDFYLHDDGAPVSWNGARHYVELRGYSGDAYGSGDLENLLAVGVTNTSDDPFDTTFYQGRVTFGSNWSTLDEEPGALNRDVGWHNMAIEVTSSEVRFSIDGVLAEVEARPNAFGFDCVVLGSDLTANNHDAWADNVGVVIIPEPGALCLLVLGGLAVIRRR